MRTYLLANTPTSAHRVTIEDGRITLTQSISFDVSSEKERLIAFLEAIKANKRTGTSCTTDAYMFVYDPLRNGLERVSILCRRTGRQITMAAATAYRLLDALTGKTERLIEEKSGGSQ